MSSPESGCAACWSDAQWYKRKMSRGAEGRAGRKGGLQSGVGGGGDGNDRKSSLGHGQQKLYSDGLVYGSVVRTACSLLTCKSHGLQQLQTHNLGNLPPACMMTNAATVVLLLPRPIAE